MKRNIFKPILALFTVGLMMVTSCSKHDGPYGDSANKDSKVESQIKKLIEGLPQIKAVRSTGIINKGGSIEDGNYVDGGWDFSNPSSGYHYSSPTGVSYSSSSNTFTLAATGGGSAGGTVVAGASSLDMTYTFCFSIDDNVNGLSLFANAASTNVAGVIGVSGDFDKLKGNAADFGDAFKGLAYYIVFSDGPASGDYDVIDWNDPKTSSNLNNTSSNSPLHNKCFAVLVDFKNDRFYFSKKGKINVSGGLMNYDGSYYELAGFKVDPKTGKYDTSTASFSEVPGFGAMGCN